MNWIFTVRLFNKNFLLRLIDQQKYDMKNKFVLVCFVLILLQIFTSCSSMGHRSSVGPISDGSWDVFNSTPDFLRARFECKQYIIFCDEIIKQGVQYSTGCILPVLPVAGKLNVSKKFVVPIIIQGKGNSLNRNFLLSDISIKRISDNQIFRPVDYEKRYEFNGTYIVFKLHFDLLSEKIGDFVLRFGNFDEEFKIPDLHYKCKDGFYYWIVNPMVE